LHDVLNKILKRDFLKVSQKRVASTKVIRAANRTRSFVEFLDNEFTDLILGLQGLRQATAKQYLEVWHYKTLVDSVQRRKKAVADAVDTAYKEKQGRYARIVEAVLAGIGGVAVLDFSINLFAFARQSKDADDPFWGLVDAARLLPVDLTLDLAIIFLLLVLILVAKKQ
jgi:hypothetical protein